MKKTLKIGTLSVMASIMLIGCGGGDSVSTESTVGYLVDSKVVNADYDCITDNELNKKTGSNGEFTCKNMSKVQFRLGKLILGEISKLPGDKHVFPQDLAGVKRSNVSDKKVTAIAQLLQSLDRDGNASNGIEIPNELKNLLTDTESHFDEKELETYLESTSIVPERRRTESQAREHLRETLRSHNEEHGNKGKDNGGKGNGGKGNGNHGEDDNETIVDPNAPLSTLTQELKDAMAYMGNEERLAYDLYTNLYNYHQAKGTTITKLQRIASNSEIKHVNAVKTLVKKYNLGENDLTDVKNALSNNSVEFENMPSGKYDVKKIQDLYDTLYAKGIQSERDALETACMVEVVDVDDLNKYIAMAKESSASDLESTFTKLRDASYSHYWSFDGALKEKGILEGCGSAGAEYAKTPNEYPQSSHGNR